MQHEILPLAGKPTGIAALARIGGLLFVLIAASVFGYRLGWFDYQHALEHLERLRGSHSFAAFITTFVLVFATGTSLGLPGLPFTVASGALFGTLLGTVLAWVGALLGSAGGYWIARTVGHDVVMRWLRRFKRVDAAVRDARDFNGMLRLRLLPILPLGTVNFACGLARSPFAPYVAATAIGILPATVIYAYFADSLLERVGNGRQEALASLIIASLLLIALSIAPRVLRSVRAN